ncbi:hypothetical protein EGJ27_13385 [Pseudomonas sp. v388]|nr:hypothetical protein EGJ27_13385 [Pseudomonas sp. v388]
MVGRASVFPRVPVRQSSPASRLLQASDALRLCRSHRAAIRRIRKLLREVNGDAFLQVVRQFFEVAAVGFRQDQFVERRSD